jgi:hypothetical protein
MPPLIAVDVTVTLMVPSNISLVDSRHEGGTTLSSAVSHSHKIVV